MNIDTTDYPLVRMDNTPENSIPIDDLLDVFSALLARGKPFVFIADMLPDRKNTNIEYGHKLTRWMKENKEKLSHLVKGHIQVIENTELHLLPPSFAVTFARFWGYPMFIVSSKEDAHKKAQSLLES